jgi:hypothetical protein
MDTTIRLDLIRRANLTDYYYGDLVAPPTLNGKIYLCTTPGTSGSSPPTFLIGDGSATTDGGVTWTEYTPAGLAYWSVMRFSINPKFGDYEREKDYVQPIDYSVGGDPYVYDKGLAAKNIRSFSFAKFLPADLKNLEDFKDLVRGKKFPFTLYDIDGEAYKVLLLNADDIKSKPVQGGYESVTTIKLLFL